MKILEEKNKSQTQKSSQKGQSLAKLLHCYSRSYSSSGESKLTLDREIMRIKYCPIC